MLTHHLTMARRSTNISTNTSTSTKRITTKTERMERKEKGRRQRNINIKNTRSTRRGLTLMRRWRVKTKPKRLSLMKTVLLKPWRKMCECRRHKEREMVEDERERAERMAREGVRFLPVGLSLGIRKEIVVDLDQSLPLLNAQEEER